MSKINQKKLFCLMMSVLALIQSKGASLIDSQTTSKDKESIVFKISEPDYNLSPSTGMTRQHWKDAALYLLNGAFSYIKCLNDPMKFPKQHGKSYPRISSEIPTEKLEGLCRTLFIAVPLLKENPELEINGIKVGDYYRHQICNLTDSNSAYYIKPCLKNGNPNQNLCEFGGLAVSLFSIPELLWNPLSQSQKDALAYTMISYGEGPTNDSNWRFFNILVLSFFKSMGYNVNENLLVEHLNRTLEHYRGNGWYSDTPAFDYYSMWAFQMYGKLWSEFFGNDYYPEFAEKFKKNFEPIKDNYPYLFSKKGEMIMWGRSISYRFAAAVPFPLMGFEKDPLTNYGWMRRIASGTLLQFLKNPDFIRDSIPTLGFYGPFDPAVQSYSCRGSVFWIGKVFLGLLVPENNSFWTVKENDGEWEKKFSKEKVFNKFQEGPNILITDYPDIGASEVRSWCTTRGDRSENYNRLSYNSAFPWQADGKAGEVAMGYLIKIKDNKWKCLQNYTFKKYESGVYYRDVSLESNKNVKLRLAEIPLQNGILRVDQTVCTDTIDLHLGHYALPRLAEPIKQEIRKVKGHEVRIIDNGVYQLAMIPLRGWNIMETIETKGLNPVAEESTIINLSSHFIPKQSSAFYITLMLWKKANEEWSNEELMPVKKILFSQKDSSVTVSFFNSEEKKISFK